MQQLRAARQEAVEAELARVAGRPPEAIEIRRTAAGRPYLDPPGPAFSVSHTRDLLAVATAPAGGGGLGVDIELLRPRPRLDRIAERAFPPAVAAQVACAASEADRLRRFYAFWTAYEAFAKALGAGLSLPARELAVAEVAGDPGALRLSHPAAGPAPYAGRRVALAGAAACVVAAAPACTVVMRGSPA